MLPGASVILCYFWVVPPRRLDHNLYIYSPVDGHLGCFQYGASKSKAATKFAHIQVFVWT